MDASQWGQVLNGVSLLGFNFIMKIVGNMSNYN